MITVVIPSYNHKDYVVQAIQSVLDQSRTDIDLIVIDDGSTDGSAEIIRRLREEKGNFRFIPRGNKGLIATLNEGLGLARGEFFCELASDDYFPPDSLRIRHDFLREHPECIAVFADGFMVQGNHETATRFIDEKRRRMFAMPDPIPVMLGGTLPVFSTGLIRTESLRHAGGFDEENFRYYEDLDTPIRLALAGKIGFLDAPVIYRREHQTNVSGTTRHIRVEKIRLYRKLLEDRRMKAYRGLLRRQLRREYLKLGRQVNESKGGNGTEKSLFRECPSSFLLDPRLLWHYMLFRQRC